LGISGSEEDPIYGVHAGWLSGVTTELEQQPAEAKEHPRLPIVTGDNETHGDAGCPDRVCAAAVTPSADRPHRAPRDSVDSFALRPLGGIGSGRSRGHSGTLQSPANGIGENTHETGEPGEPALVVGVRLSPHGPQMIQWSRRLAGQNRTGVGTAVPGQDIAVHPAILGPDAGNSSSGQA
jgi:hypothetical protein